MKLHLMKAVHPRNAVRPAATRISTASMPVSRDSPFRTCISIPTGSPGPCCVNGQLAEAGWDEAVSTAADKLQAIIRDHGAESIGMLASSKMLNEEVYLSQKFQRAVIGNNHVDNCARL